MSEDMGTIQTINNNVWEDVAKELEDELGDLDDTDFDSDTRLATLLLGSFIFSPSAIFIDSTTTLFWTSLTSLSLLSFVMIS